MTSNVAGNVTSNREAMLANMAASLFMHRRITTTLPKAKAVMPFVDKLATLARRGDPRVLWPEVR